MKLLVRLFVGVVVILVVAIGLLWFYLDGIVKRGIEAYAPEYLGVPVTLTSVHISPLSGMGDIVGLVVGSPTGFKGEYVFRLDSVRVVVEPRSIFSDTVLIKEISINAPDVIYEFGMRGTNIAALQRNVERAVGGGSVKAASSSSSSSDAGGKAASAGKKVIISHLYVRDGRVRPMIGKAVVTVKLPDIHLRDIGKKQGGTSFADATRKVLGAVAKGVGGIKNMPGVLGAALPGIEGDVREGIEGIKKGLEGMTDSLKKLF